MQRPLGSRSGQAGFTLIELMVVVLIIAILIAIAIPTFLGARSRAQDRAAHKSASGTCLYLRDQATKAPRPPPGLFYAETRPAPSHWRLRSWTGRRCGRCRSAR